LVTAFGRVDTPFSESEVTHVGSCPREGAVARGSTGHQGYSLICCGRSAFPGFWRNKTRWKLIMYIIGQLQTYFVPNVEKARWAFLYMKMGRQILSHWLIKLDFLRPRLI